MPRSTRTEEDEVVAPRGAGQMHPTPLRARDAISHPLLAFV